MLDKSLLALPLVLLLATPVLAASNHVFIYSDELGQMLEDDVETSMPFQEYSTANADAAFTTTYGDDSNDFAIRYNVGSGAATYQSRTRGLSAEGTVCALAYLRVATSCPTRRKILSFEDGSGNDTAFLTMESTNAGQFRLRTWYEDMGNECVTATNNGTECTVDSDCGSANPGEASCTNDERTAYGSSDHLDEGTWYSIGLEQDNTGGGEGGVKVSLYVGEPGAVFAYSQRTKPQGSCVTAQNCTNEGDACDADADCTGCDTPTTDDCTTTDIRTTALVNFGTDDTTAAACDYALDNLVIVNTSCSGYENYRIQALIPDGEGTPVDWSDANGCGNTHNGCLDENISRANVVPDGDTSRLQTTSDGTVGEVTVENVTLTDTCTASACVNYKIACTVAADCTMSVTNAGAATVSSINRTTSAPDSPLNIAILMEEAANQTASVTAQIDQHSDGSFRPDGYLVATTAPDGGTWTEADFDALELVYTYNKQSCTSNCRAKITTSIMDAFFTLPSPPVPTVIPDNDADGTDTVGFIGASTLNGPIEAGNFDGLVEVLNIYDCARGGATVGDFENNITNLKEGVGAGYLSCEARKGSTGATLDVAVVMLGINSMRSMNLAPPSVAIACDANADCLNGNCTDLVCTGGGFCTGTLTTCNNNADCGYCQAGQQGYCEDDGGADQGNACYCSKTDWWLSDITDPGTTRHCIVGGTDWKTACDSSSDCACSVNGDCQSGSTCSGSVCTLGGGKGMTCAINSTKPLSMCVAGCLSADGCANGVCVAGNAMAEITKGYQSGIDTLLANNSDVVLVPTPNTEEVLDKIGTGVQTGCWGWMPPLIGGLNAWLKDLAATDADLHFVDGAAVFKHCCPNGDTNECLKDGAHYNAAGEQCLADAIIDCLTNADGTADGTCAASTCTTGRAGDACSVDADCDTYRCAF